MSSVRLSISGAQLPDDPAAQTLTGTIDADDAGLGIAVYDGAALLATTMAADHDVWTYNAALSGSGVHAFSATASGDDEILTSDTAYLATSGGQRIDLADPAGDSASLYDTAGDWDTVYGSGARIYLAAAEASVVGGDDVIALTGPTRDKVSLYNTSGQGDAVTGDDDYVDLTNAEATVSGGYNTIFSQAAGNSVKLAATNGDWDWVYGDDGFVTLSSAQASVIGGDDTISLTGAGDKVSLYNTYDASSLMDAVTGDDAVVVLTNARASVTGGYNKIYLEADDDWANLYATNGQWDLVYGHDNDDSVTLNSAQASVIGNVQVNLVGASRDYLSLYDTTGSVPEYVNAINALNGDIGSETISLTDANAIVSGANNTIYLDGASGNQLTVEETQGGHGDWVYGDNALVNVLTANASVIGNGDTVYFGSFPFTYYGNDTVSVSASAADLLEFGQRIRGEQTVNGFDSSDVMQFSAADFANWGALSGHLSQSDDNAVIFLEQGDEVILTGVSASSLTAAQFRFV